MNNNEQKVWEDDCPDLMVSSDGQAFVTNDFEPGHDIDDRLENCLIISISLFLFLFNLFIFSLFILSLPYNIIVIYFFMFFIIICFIII